MHDEQGSSNAGDARGPVWRKVRWVDRCFDAGQTRGSTREGEGGQDGFSSFVHRCAVWAPFNERTHLHTRAGPRGKEPPLLLAAPRFVTCARRARSSLELALESSTGAGMTRGPGGTFARLNDCPFGQSAGSAMPASSLGYWLNVYARTPANPAEVSDPRTRVRTGTPPADATTSASTAFIAAAMVIKLRLF